MAAGKRVSTILKPLSDAAMQTYLGTGLHTLGLLGWILEQTGRADVYVSTFSTSDAFLCGFLRLKKKSLIRHSVLLADLKASKKTVQLFRLMQSCFDTVYLSMNHSKIVLVRNERWSVTVITSQNQTYGDRAECTLVTTDANTFEDVWKGLSDIINNSKQMNGLFNRLDSEDREIREESDDSLGDFVPFGY